MNRDVKDNANRINFVDRPIPVPYNYRIVYKISLITLIIGMMCKRGGCLLTKIHILSNALSSNKNMKDVEDFIENKKENISVIRFEPAVTRAINYALAEKLIEMQQNKKMKLTDKGRELFFELTKDDEVMIIEKQYLKSIEGKFTDDMIKNMINKWGNINGTNKSSEDNS